MSEADPATTRGLRAGWRLLRAAAAQGQAAAPPLALLPLAARLGAQGLLNAQFLPAHADWQLLAWMRAQDDPAAPGFHPRAHALLTLNTTARNWTAIGLPGHPAEGIVDPRGLVTPWPAGPSLDCWIQPADGPLLAAQTAAVSAIRQRMQGRLPVVATGFESGTLRLATEAWVGVLADEPIAHPWVVMQAVVFNLSDDPARGHFYFAVRPFNPEGVAPIRRLAYARQAFCVDGRLFAVLLPRPPAWDCDPGAGPDLAGALPQLAGRHTAQHPAGRCHGVAAYRYHIAPWEEAEFLAFLPLAEQAAGSGSSITPLKTQNSIFSYTLLKGQATRAWQARLDAGLMLRLPDARWEESWRVNVGHLLVLHDGAAITPGPALYHRFWMRDAAYLLAALATCGYGAAARQVLASYPGRRQADGRFAGPAGEGDATGAALWTLDRVDQLAPAGLRAEIWLAIQEGVGWIARARRGRRPPGAAGLLPASRGANHFGPPDYYYWDNFWALAGLEASARQADRRGRRVEAGTWRAEAADLRAALDRSIGASTPPGGAIPAAPGRRADSSMVGTLAAWHPLALYPTDDPRLAATLRTLAETSMYEGAFFERTVHHGWGTYLNMSIAASLLRLRSPAGAALVGWLLHQATPTYTWPEAIHPHTGGGSMGDGHHGWACAAWLLLLRDCLLFEDALADRLVLLAGLPTTWLDTDGAVEAPVAPTTFGPVTLRAAWQADPGTLRLALDAPQPPPGGYELCLPRPLAAATRDGAPLLIPPVAPPPDAGAWGIPRNTQHATRNTRLPLPPETRVVEVQFSKEA